MFERFEVLRDAEMSQYTTLKLGGPADYLAFPSGEEEIAALGTMSSHGCIRVDPRTTEENAGINSWWIWTHLGHDTKIIITPEK